MFGIHQFTYRPVWMGWDHCSTHRLVWMGWDYCSTHRLVWMGWDHCSTHRGCGWDGIIARRIDWCGWDGIIARRIDGVDGMGSLLDASTGVDGMGSLLDASTGVDGMGSIGMSISTEIHVSIKVVGIGTELADASDDRLCFSLSRVPASGGMSFKPLFCSIKSISTDLVNKLNKCSIVSIDILKNSLERCTLCSFRAK